MDEMPRDLFFGELIHSYMDDPYFQPRPWLSGQIEALLAEPDCRFVLLLGEPGAGKSALQASLAAAQPEWPRYFIRRDSQHPLRSGDARSFLFAVGHQLAVRRPQLFDPGRVKIVVEQRISEQLESGQAVGVDIGELIASPFYQTSLQVSQQVEVQAGDLIGLSIGRLTPEPRFMELNNLQFLALLNPAELLSRLDPQQRLVVQIDALDELRYSVSQDSLLHWLADLPELPDNLRFVLTSRPDDALLADFRQRQAPRLREIRIEPDSEAVQADLRSYTRGFAAAPAIQAHLQAEQVDAALFIQTVVERADGNFLYLTLLRRGIEQAIDQNDREALPGLLHAEEIPESLEGLYAHFLTRLRAQVGEARIEIEGETPLEIITQPAWETLYQPVLGVLSVAFEPIEPAQIRRLARLQVEERFLQSALQRLAQFLEQGNGRVSLFHATLAEFLTSPGASQRRPALYLDPIEWHRKIAGAYRKGAPSWEQVDWEQVDDYGLLHLPRHLHALAAEKRFRPDFYSLFCSPFVEEKRLRYGSYAQVHQDLNLGIETALESLPAELPVLARLVLLRAILSAITSSLPEPVITALAQLGESQQALGAAALIQAPDKQARAYAQISHLMIESGQKTEIGRTLKLAAAAAWQHIFNSIGLMTVSHDDIAAYLAKPAAIAAQAGKLIEYLRAYQQAGGSLDPYLLALLADQIAQVLSREGAIETAHLAIANLENWNLQPDIYLALLAFAARALARAGEAGEARELIDQAQRFASEHPTEGAELWLAPALALLGDFDQAKAITLENLQYQESQEALLVLAQALVRAGQLGPALELAKHAEDDDKKDELLKIIVLALAERGDDQEAVKTAERMIYGDRYAAALRDLAAVQARAGRLAAALQSIHLLANTRQKSALPLTLSEQGQGIQAEIRTNVPELQADLLRMLAGFLHQKTEPASQKLPFAELESFTRSENASLQAAAARLTAAASLAAGDLQMAQAIFADLPAGFDRLELMSELIHALVERGEVDAARKLIDDEEELTDDGAALMQAELALALHGAGQIEQAELEMEIALSLLERLPASEQAVLGLCAAAAQLIASGKPEAAHRLLELGSQICEDLDEIIPYVRCSSRLIQAYSQAGLLQQARDLIEQTMNLEVNDYSTQAEALRCLLPAAAALNNPGFTLHLAAITLQAVGQLDEPLEQAETVAVVIRCLAENGLFEEALDLANKLDNPLYKMQALGDLLERLDPQGDRALTAQAASAAQEQMQQGTAMWQYHGKNVHIVSDDIVQNLHRFASGWRLEALAYNRLARGLMHTGYTDPAEAAFAKALELAEKETGYAEGPAMLAELADTAIRLGEKGVAEEVAEQALELTEQAEDWETYALGLSSAAQAHQAAGEAGKAQELALEAWQALARFSLAARESIYQVLERSAEVLAAIDAGKTLEEVGDSLVEVEGWWVE